MLHLEEPRGGDQPPGIPTPGVRPEQPPNPQGRVVSTSSAKKALFPRDIPQKVLSCGPTSISATGEAEAEASRVQRLETGPGDSLKSNAKGKSRKAKPHLI